MSLPAKQAVEIAAGISVTGAVTAWFAENLVFVQWGASVAAIVAAWYAIRVSRKNLRK